MYDQRPPKTEPSEKNPTPDNKAHDEWRPTKWGMRVLDSRVLGILKDKSTKLGIDPTRPDEEVTTQVGQNDYYFQVCQLGLTEETEGYEVKYQSGKRNIGGKSYPIATAEYVGTIPDYVIAELAERIIAGNTLTADEGNASA
jgi:hypothetical protein